MKDQWIDWLQDKQRHFFYGITVIVAALFVAFQMFGKFHKPTTSRFITASQVFEKWISQGEAFEKLDHILASSPDLATKFGVQVADKFIAQNEGEKAQPFADAVLRRAYAHTPHHSTFAEGSLLIAKGDFREALTSAVTLKEHVEPSSLLYGFNLVRIASLYRAINAGDQELSALDELDTYLKSQTEITPVLLECFREDSLTLTDYISHRKTAIH